MIIDINKLKYQGKDESEFSFDYQPERVLIDLPGAEIDGCIKVEGVVSISGKSAYVDGKVSYLLKGECSRCLSRAEMVVSEPLEIEFSSLAGAEFVIKAGKIDLTLPVEELIITSAPLVIYCKEDCKGVCFGCGANLNESKCTCKN